jgi:branched-chain amino acid transport system substrate-binding protein
MGDVIRSGSDPLTQQWMKRYNNPYQEGGSAMKTRFCFCSILSLALTVFLAVAAVAAPEAPPTIPVGVAVSLSGPYSNLGHQAKAGYEIATEEINRAGGVLVKEYGKKIPLELSVQDTESIPAKAVARMEWLFTSKKVVAYVGEGNIVNGQGVAEKNKIATLVIAAPHQTAHDRGLKYWFSPGPKSPDNAKVIFDVLGSIPSDKRPKTVAIFQEHTDWAIEQAETFNKEALQRGYKVVAFEKYPRMSKDLSPMIMAAKNAGAEVVLSSPIMPDGMAMMRQMKELDYNPKAIVVIRGAEDLPWAKALGPMGEYVVFTGCNWHHTVKLPGSDKVSAAHQAKFGRPADVLAGPGYASMQILAAAIEKAGTLETTKIRDAIAATDMMTVIGKVKFRPNGTAIDPTPVTIQWLKGQQRLVWPQEMRELPFSYPVPPWKER